jgi:PKD repeat protein
VGDYTYTVTASKAGCSTPQTAQVTVRVVLDVNPGVCLALGDQCSGNSQEIRQYSLSVTAAGNYPLRLSYRSHEGATQGRIRVNGGSWQTFNLPQTPANLSFASVDIGSYALLNGSNSIELATGGSYLCFRDLCLDAPNLNPNCGFTVKADPSTLTVAPGGTVSLSTTCSGSGCEGVAYQWSGNGATCASASCTVQAPTAAGSYTYTLTASKQGCTSQTTTVTVQVSTAVLPERCVALGDQCSGNSQEIRSYSLSLTAAGSYPLSLTYRSHEGASQARIRINGGNWLTFSLAQTPGDLSYATANIGTYLLTAGSNTVELSTTERYICFRQLCAAEPTSAVRMAAAESYEPQIRQLTTFPNPTQGEFTASFYVAPGSKADLMVSDMQGRNVWQKKLTGTGWQSERVSLPNAAAGTYILGLYTNTDSATPTLEFKRVLLIK